MPFPFLKNFSRIALLSLLCSLTASADQTALGSVSGDLVAAVGSSLPSDCLVIYVQENEVYLDITREKGAAVGRKFVIERPGVEIRHPVTGEVVGRAQTRIGEVQITWLQEGFCKARVVGATAEGGIRVKDTARPVEGPVVVRYLMRHDDGSVSRLTELLDGEIAAALGTIASLTQKTGPALAMTAGGAVSSSSALPEADVAVGGRVVGDSIELHVVSLATNSVVKTLYGEVPVAIRLLGAEKARAAGIAAPAASGAAVGGALEPVAYREGGEVSAALNFDPLDMTAADVDGDGIDELIFGEERHVRIMRIKLGGVLEEVARLSVGWASRIFHVTAGDIDRDGKAEIYVIEKPGNYIRAAGYRFAGGRLDRFWKENDIFLRVVRTSEGDVLFGQRYGSGRPFERGIVRYRFAGAELQSASAGVPGAFTLYDFAAIGTSGFYASIDYENRLRLYSHAGEIQWTSSENYGGSDVKIMSADGRNEMEERGGIAALDLDGDQVEELLVVQNLLEGGLGTGFVRIGALQQYKSGRIVAMSLESNQLVERWKTKTYSGLIKGFTIARPLGRGREAVFFTLEKISFRERRATLRVVPIS
jgi:hypothetical protein